MQLPVINSRTILLLLGICLCSAAVLLNRALSKTPEQIAERAGKRIEKKLQIAEALIDTVAREDSAELFSPRFTSFFEKEKIALYLFINDTLVAWNNSQLPFRSRASLIARDDFVQLGSGYYYYAQTQTGNRNIIALITVKPRFALQNRYLSNNFYPWLGIPDDIKLAGPDDDRVIDVKVNNKPIFQIHAAEQMYTAKGADDVCFLLWITGLLTAFAALLLFIRGSISPLTALVLIPAVIVLRVLMLIFEWPAFFYTGTLYDVRIFGNAQSPANSYLGDILLNGLFLLYVATALQILYDKLQHRLYKLLLQCLALATLLLSVIQFNAAVQSLVSNSTLSFNFLDFINVSFPAFVGIVCLALAALVIFQLLFFLVTRWPAKKPVYRLYLLTALLLINVLVLVFSASSDLAEAFWLLLPAILLYVAVKISRLGVITCLGVFLLVMSGITSSALNRYIAINEAQDLEVLSVKLGERQDPVLENEFKGIPEKIKADEKLRNLFYILPSTADAIKDLLSEKYFSGYFKRYTVEYSLFDSKCRPLLESGDPLLLSEEYFNDQIRYHADSTQAEGLFFVKHYRLNARYIARIEIGSQRLFVVLEPKQFEEMGSFPDLLLDESQQKHEKLQGFSYAVYRSQQNTSSFGNLNYPPFLPDSAKLSQAEPSFTHRFFSPDNYTSVVISRPVKTWSYFFTFNSYMLLLFGAVCYVLLFLYGAIFAGSLRGTSLTRRFQAIIIILLLVAISAVGYNSAKLVRDQFASENKNELRDKTEFIYTDLSATYQPAQLFDQTNKDALATRLNEYARLFNTDISLFDSGGRLYVTTQPRLYSLGLSAELAHPVALAKLSGNQSAAVSIHEKAGKLFYLSLYTAIYDKNSAEPAGYINLPYFARQSDLVTELSGIVSGLVNVYVILLVLSILAGLILAGYITRPLRLIQQQIARISLGKRNEKIVWSSNDELGRLIGEYNQMLVKLEESATLLAQSERESAWREMAKQVAHEIKNPLTPMKLNLQYLQHLIKNDPADFREKFEKASAGIIEQIDSLANIANEFSNFAKLPVTHLETINIAEVIRSSVLIFENRGEVQIKNRIVEDEIAVKGDREQCLRVFNNLFTNALQALQDTALPVIEIGRQLKDDVVIIQVRDNGAGIDEQLKPKIFTPNFTTKTTGSGLGLAMVKNIMEGFGGRIWFESEKGLGTIFYLEFRMVTSKADPDV